MELEHEEFGEGVEELAAKAIRPPMRLSCEDLVASELASGILSEPLSKIRHVCEALMLLDEIERRQAEINEDEIKEAKKLYALATTLQNVHINREMISYNPPIMIDRYAKISWPFPKENAAEWLGWLGDDFEAQYFQIKEKKHEFKELPRFEAIYKITSNCEAAMETYRGIVIRFVNYAMPKATVLMKKIITLVSPDSYREALKILRGAKRAKA